MRILDIIAAKRDGSELADKYIRQIVLDYAEDRIPDYQMSAFLMAAYIRGMSFVETAALTQAMVESGETLDLSTISGVTVDKHSTGGVGDKTSLVVVPILAACGLKVPKMSGRGLGFTGGTLDKLESIPGFQTKLAPERFVAQVNEVGCAIAGQTANLVPADKKLYALRDVTATVNSIPLIAASIMSKKIACSSEVIILDVKTGCGAFMRDIESARKLAQSMMAIGRGFGRKVAAMITDMNQPLGRAVGNALEVAEAIDVLKGGSSVADFRTLCTELSSVALQSAGVCNSRDEGVLMTNAVLDSGKALDVFRRMIEAQGGDVRVVENPDLLPKASLTTAVKSTTSGVVTGVDCAAIGVAASLLGAGRERKEDDIDPAVGVLVKVRIGDKVNAGDVIAVIHANNKDRMIQASRTILESFVFGESAKPPKLIHEVLD